MNVSDILKAKGREVCAIGADRPVREALSLLNSRRIGALIVLDAQGQIAGILTERDILRHLNESGGTLGPCAAGRLMTPRERLIIATEDDDVGYAMNVMTSNRIRHLPVIGKGRLVGLLSIGDLVKAQLADTEHENKMLQDYISGRYPA